MQKNLHIKGKFEFGFSVWIINLEEAVNEFFQVHIATVVQVKHAEKAISNNTRQASVLRDKSYKYHKRSAINNFH